MQEFYKFSVLTLARLKILNRDLHLDIDSQRKDLNNRKISLEKLQLSYENLLYEKAHLMRQIEATKDLSTPHLDEIARERGHRVEILTYQENLEELEKRSLEELEEEMNERIATKKVLDTLEDKSKSLNEVLDKKRRFMDDLPKKIAHIRSTTMDLSQQFVDVLPVEEIIEEEVTTNVYPNMEDVAGEQNDSEENGTKMDEA
jgi:THO complex subunit 5